MDTHKLTFGKKIKNFAILILSTILLNTCATIVTDAVKHPIYTVETLASRAWHTFIWDFSDHDSDDKQVVKPIVKPKTK